MIRHFNSLDKRLVYSYILFMPLAFSLQEVRQDIRYETVIWHILPTFILYCRCPLGIVEPTRRNLVMARLTPTVHEGMLTTYLLDGTEQTMELDDERWQRWLRECAECSFRFTSPLGTFSVRCSNGRYWYICLMHKRQRYKHYLGKSESVTLSVLYQNAETVYEDIHGQPPSAPLLALAREELSAYQQHAAVLSTPPRCLNRFPFLLSHPLCILPILASTPTQSASRSRRANSRFSQPLPFSRPMSKSHCC